MNISETLVQDLATSMRAGDSTKTGVVRLLKSSLKNEEIKLGHPLSEAEMLKVVQREAKQRKDSIEQYEAAGRDDLVATERAELEIIQDYLPPVMSSDELDAVIDEVMATTGATTMAQMGQVIGQVMAKVGAQADGGAVAAAVKAKLTA